MWLSLASKVLTWWRRPVRARGAFWRCGQRHHVRVTAWQAVWLSIRPGTQGCYRGAMDSPKGKRGAVSICRSLSLPSLNLTLKEIRKMDPVQRTAK